VKALDVFPKEHRRFISSLSELRNQLVHDLRNVNFTFSEYIQTLNPEQTDKFVQAFSYGLRERIVTEGRRFGERNGLNGNLARRVVLRTLLHG
jgi:hypothetical protein